MDRSIRLTRASATALRMSALMLAGLLVLLGGSGRPLAAQQTGSVLGQVVTEGAGTPLEGAQVFIQQLDVGTITDQAGNFLIPEVPAGSYTLSVQLLGFAAYEAEVAVVAGEAARVEVALSQTAIQLEGVVVTALGVERQERSLGYAAQSVDIADATTNRPTNILNALHGKVAGMEVVSSSLSGNNQPLIVVDGVYIDNSNFGAPEQFSNSADYGNAAMDISPEEPPSPPPAGTASRSAAPRASS